MTKLPNLMRNVPPNSSNAARGNSRMLRRWVGRSNPKALVLVVFYWVFRRMVSTAPVG
jgi:hypothetical protein